MTTNKKDNSKYEKTGLTNERKKVMINQMKEKINAAIRAGVRKLSEEEGRWYVEAEWLQNHPVKIESHVVDFLIDAEEKGYTADDLVVKVKTSTPLGTQGLTINFKTFFF